MARCYVAHRPAVDPKTFFGELKRRNVYKVAVAYAVVAWRLMSINKINSESFGVAAHQSDAACG